MPIEKKSQPRVIFFSTPSCTYCNAVKRYFREKGVKFRDVDVSRDAATARDMVTRSGQTGLYIPETAKDCNEVLAWLLP